MKTIINAGAQGDVLFIRVDEIPIDATLITDAASHVVAHSETGHHHIAKRRAGMSLDYFDTSDPLVSYLRFRGGSLPIDHHRDHHTHETVELLDKSDAVMDEIDATLRSNHFKVVRQRQHTPEGWARVMD